MQPCKIMHRPYNIFPAFRITLPPGKPFFDHVPVAVAVRSDQISFGIFQEQIAAYPSFCQEKKALCSEKTAAPANRKIQSPEQALCPYHKERSHAPALCFAHAGRTAPKSPDLFHSLLIPPQFLSIKPAIKIKNATRIVPYFVLSQFWHLKLLYLMKCRGQIYGKLSFGISQFSAFSDQPFPLISLRLL